ncbi:hypothetical protein BIV57_14480 [Mangrovactinospora gilvigrisea]|uniref:SHOCT domain-containing protein n=1 Tax=Mangrovactinospora gilvigrisea TaxID=1428644 RepID=A0A1J7BDM0_9ACTN|nr:SHOCT domain-containing protein [Mangrovactinospora gilvigrisea]OIV36775.1 hypothetical protein BIV57_14480 [Mangrovactinospora gilvigrisea]
MGAPLLRGMLMGAGAVAPGQFATRDVRRGPDFAGQDTAIWDLHAAPAAEEVPATIERLARLAEMAQQGLLTPEEFAAAKAKLLA